MDIIFSFFVMKKMRNEMACSWLIASLRFFAAMFGTGRWGLMRLRCTGRCWRCRWRSGGRTPSWWGSPGRGQCVLVDAFFPSLIFAAPLSSWQVTLKWKSGPGFFWLFGLSDQILKLILKTLVTNCDGCRRQSIKEVRWPKDLTNAESNFPSSQLSLLIRFSCKFSEKIQYATATLWL